MKYRVLYDAIRSLAEEMIQRIDTDGVPAMHRRLVLELGRSDGRLVNDRPFEYEHVAIIQGSYVLAVDRVTPRVLLVRLEPEQRDVRHPTMRDRMRRVIREATRSNHTT